MKTFITFFEDFNERYIEKNRRPNANSPGEKNPQRIDSSRHIDHRYGWLCPCFGTYLTNVYRIFLKAPTAFEE